MQPSFQTINPCNNKLIKTFDIHSQNQVENILTSARQNYKTLQNWPLEKRANILIALADILESKSEALAKLMTLEIGKPITEGEDEIKKCALVCKYYAENGPLFLHNEVVKVDNNSAQVIKQSLGTVLAIMPWNFPFWQTFRVAAAAFMSGNTILLKPANNTPQCALAIAEIFAEATKVRGILQTLFVKHNDIEKIIADKRINSVSLTGSFKAGSSVAQLAGKYMKSCVMELGGCDPFIIFADANLAEASTQGVHSRCINAGQSCIAAKRFLIEKSIYNNFCEIITNKMQNLIVGDPINKNTSMGPLATKQQQQILHEQVTDAKKQGAQILCGGKIPEGDNCFYPPTVITEVTSKMRIWNEETFGPVATIIPFDNDEEALRIANGTEFGLGASIWTTSKKRISKFTNMLECGSVYINDFVKSNPKLPFGGIKNSGYGHELAKEGLLNFVNLKTVYEKQ
ncbi:MAG: NAD-dependent succinate-semialdehyde dehydrogenase [bacterium]|nr:NAD-dependent succinate-semialdehyde dehydrogenase [bacterium]